MRSNRFAHEEGCFSQHNKYSYLVEYFAAKLVCLRKIVDFRDDIWRCKTLHRDDKILCNKKT